MESPEPVVLNSPGSHEKGINDCFYVLFFLLQARMVYLLVPPSGGI